MHGGDVYGISEKLGIAVEECVDFSANINPLGIPAGVAAAMRDAITRAVHYPDPDCRQLTEALSGKLGIRPEYILCGNGGADILYRIAYAAMPKHALLAVPTFLEYEEALRQTGAKIHTYRMDGQMEVREDILEWITDEIDILFLCTPNNPTGLLIPEAVLEAILKRTAVTGTRVVLDECFMDFVVEEKRRSMIGSVEDYKNLIIVKSFTKLYGIPGIRLGYGVSSDLGFLQRMRSAGQTWAVNSIALAAGLAALGEEEFARDTVEYVRREREWLSEELKRLGFLVYDGQADYLFFRAPGQESLYEQLLEERIIIRRCCNYENLTAEHYRVAVKRHEENLRLVQSLKKILGRKTGRKTAKVIMVQGTMSNSGKSFLTAGLCRVFAQDGYRVAPFKSQNMALNSYITEEGLEIGRAQAMQAEAAGIRPSVDMNPILLKPTSNVGSQVIVNGEVYGNMKAAEYYQRKTEFIPEILAAFERLASQYDIIVIEGAGSPAEINLRENDIVNMGLAKMVKAPVLLAGDIDRGGVFAALYGTVKLLEPEEQQMIKGLVVNKFRGDVSILEPGLRMIEEKTGIPVVGVVPMERIDLDDEDSLSDRLTKTAAGDGVDVAVLHLPHISNFTDFGALERIEGVSLRYVASPGQLGTPDLILLPGTKNTMDDMKWLRETGLETLVLKAAERQTPIIGICGGFQLLGKTLKDPYGVEHGGEMRGLGLLDADTVFAREKTRTRVKGTWIRRPEYFGGYEGTEVSGYEIHMGQTVNAGDCVEAIRLEDGRCDALCSRDGLVFGTYLHGIFDSDGLAFALASSLAERKGMELKHYEFDLLSYKEKEYDKLADLIRSSFDMKEVYRILEEGI